MSQIGVVRPAVGPEDTDVLTGGAASQSNLERLLTGKNILHIATHGVVREDDPMQSFLALAAATPLAKSDGRLTAADVYHWKLGAELVFLSACGSGTGQLSGDGVIGLTRPFLYAGAPTVVATLSDIADEPSYLLVKSFYRAWLQERDAAAALRNAQLKLLNELREQKIFVNGSSGTVRLPENPLLWAGFVVVGNPR